MPKCLTIRENNMKLIESETLERRNELIAEMLHRVHFIEKWGRGIKLMLSKEPDAEFSEVGTKFITTFKRKSYYEGKKGVEMVGEGSQKILDIMREQPSVTIKGLAEKLRISDRAVKKKYNKTEGTRLNQAHWSGQGRLLGSGEEMKGVKRTTGKKVK